VNHDNSNSRFRTLTLAAILALAGAAAPLAIADDTAPADATTSTDDALKGPEVKDRNVPGGRSTFGGGQGERRRDGAGGPGPMVMLRVLRSLNSEQAPEEVRASPEQADEIKSILDDFRDDQKAFRDEHAEEIKTLREKAGLPAGEPRRGPGGPDGAAGPGDPPPEGEGDAPRGKGKQARKQQRAEATPEQQEARQQLKALMEKGPKFETYQTEIWEVLSAEQQSYVKAKVEEARANMDEMGGPRGREGKGKGDDTRPQRGKGAKKRNPEAQPADDDMMSPTPSPAEVE